LRASIQQAFPEDSIEGEERPDFAGTNDFSWTLDPIDGTRAFVAGVPVWSTLIALSHNGEAVLGMIDLPALDTCYVGRTDDVEKRAWVVRAKDALNNLSTKTCPEIRDGILGCTAPFGMFRPGELAAFKIIGSGTKFMRLGLDALGYGLLAEGRMDIIIEAGMKPCDVRALIPIVEGAGGRLTNWEGGSAADGGRVQLLTGIHIITACLHKVNDSPIDTFYPESLTVVFSHRQNRKAIMMRLTKAH